MWKSTDKDVISAALPEDSETMEVSGYFETDIETETITLSSGYFQSDGVFVGWGVDDKGQERCVRVDFEPIIDG